MDEKFDEYNLLESKRKTKIIIPPPTGSVTSKSKNGEGMMKPGSSIFNSDPDDKPETPGVPP